MFFQKGVTKAREGLLPVFSYRYMLSATKIKRKPIPLLFFLLEKHFFSIFIAAGH